MIKVALKHWVYEYCISQIFSGISKNFNISNINIKNIKIGDTFRLIECFNDGMTFNDKELIMELKTSLLYDCYITYVDNNKIKFSAEKIDFYNDNTYMGNARKTTPSAELQCTFFIKNIIRMER